MHGVTDILRGIYKHACPFLQTPLSYEIDKLLQINVFLSRNQWSKMASINAWTVRLSALDFNSKFLIDRVGISWSHDHCETEIDEGRNGSTPCVCFHSSEICSSLWIIMCLHFLFSLKKEDVSWDFKNVLRENQNAIL